MEAPDSLYLSHLVYNTFQYQIPDPDDDTQIEYVRKDTFIKRISELLSSRVNEYVYYNDKTEFINDFINDIY